MLILMMAATAAAATPVPTVREWGGDIDRRVMRAALRAPERAGKEKRYCFLDDITRPGEVRRVCRTRYDWNRHGLDPNA